MQTGLVSASGAETIYKAVVDVAVVATSLAIFWIVVVRRQRSTGVAYEQCSGKT